MSQQDNFGIRQELKAGFFAQINDEPSQALRENREFSQESSDVIRMQMNLVKVGRDGFCQGSNGDGGAVFDSPKQQDGDIARIYRPAKQAGKGTFN